MKPTAQSTKAVGQDAIAKKGWLVAHKWLLLRRLSQLAILALFMAWPLHFQQQAATQASREAAPAADAQTEIADQSAKLQALLGSADLNAPAASAPSGASRAAPPPAAPGAIEAELPAPVKQPTEWLLKGNLSSSLLFETIPLTDPWLFVQTLAAGIAPAANALLGAAIVFVFYLLVGGRVFCAWVCPVNLVTDFASWLRRKLGIKGGTPPDARTRFWLMGAIVAGSVLSGTLFWEWVNPVSIAHRGLIFGMGAGLWILLAVFVYDLVVAQRGWCGHLCPTGAFYSLLGKFALPRVSAARRSACNDCMDCFAVCPEPQVIRPALKQQGQESPVIGASQCTTCGRCIDVCSERVFRMTYRFDQRSSS
ncbi:MAG: quinol dehydrogenase ferredoxin subunit NapH [Zoogloeaceae bacterium]|jgi:ferredoxin-type protein NapH|nr:quinol dehydrogenase ferredoxin subunit NapH [Zoogloeaceae bacterium]